jgi:hypothetical protein
VMNIKWPNYLLAVRTTARRFELQHGGSNPRRRWKVVLCGVLFCVPYQWIKPRQKRHTKGHTSGYENYWNIGKTPWAQSATVDRIIVKLLRKWQSQSWQHYYSKGTTLHTNWRALVRLK